MHVPVAPSEGETAADLPTVRGVAEKTIAAAPALYEAHFELGILYQISKDTRMLSAS